MPQPTTITPHEVNKNKYKVQSTLFTFTELCNLQCHIIMPPYLDFESDVFPAVLRSEDAHHNITFWIRLFEQSV
jgi:hypothetical protein